MESDDSQKLAIENIVSGKNVAVLGPAGHGKTFVLQSVTSILRDRYGDEAVVVVASTNENASLFQSGVTFHSLLGLQVLPKGQEWTVNSILEKVRNNEFTQAKIKKLRALGLDEGPVLPFMQFESLVLIVHEFADDCQFYTGGDPLQRGPFSRSLGILPFAFQSPFWAALFRVDRTKQDAGEICLRVNHRLKNAIPGTGLEHSSSLDIEEASQFSRALELARLGLQNMKTEEAQKLCHYFNTCSTCGMLHRFSDETIDLRRLVNMKGNISQDLPGSSFETENSADETALRKSGHHICCCSQVLLPTRLSPSNLESDNYNSKCLGLLSGLLHEIDAEDQNFHLSNDAACDTLSSLAMKTLRVKVGCMIMTTRYLPELELPARSRGFVEEVHENGSVTCSFPVKNVSDVSSASRRKVTITKVKHEVRGLKDGRLLCYRTQVPLKLSYSLTFAGSIGMEFEFIEVDFRKGWEAPGLGYTALSRATSKSGLKCIGLKPDFLTSDPNALDYWNYIQNASP